MSPWGALSIFLIQHSSRCFNIHKVTKYECGHLLGKIGHRSKSIPPNELQLRIYYSWLIELVAEERKIPRPPMPIDSSRTRMCLFSRGFRLNNCFPQLICLQFGCTSTDAHSYSVLNQTTIKRTRSLPTRNVACKMLTHC